VVYPFCIIFQLLIKITGRIKFEVKDFTCNPSKKLSPMMMTVDPPVVQPSLGEIALITGTAADG
jgi:hypothetical protein